MNCRDKEAQEAEQGCVMHESGFYSDHVKLVCRKILEQQLQSLRFSSKLKGWSIFCEMCFFFAPFRLHKLSLIVTQCCNGQQICVNMVLELCS